MKTAFRDAFIKHFNDSDARVVDVVNQTGVSRSKINKLLRKENDKVIVEDAIALASFFGKSVEQLLSGQTSSARDQISALAEILTDEEAGLLAAQIKGVVAHRLNELKQHEANAATQG